MDFATYSKISHLLMRYAQILDSNDICGWPDLFTPECTYQLQSRENFDAGHPLCILHLESQAMLRDRVYGVTHTIFHDPYSQRHICSAPIITPIITPMGSHGFACESSYVVVRTPRDKQPHIVSVGRYLDEIVSWDGEFKFSKRVAIFDNDLLPNSVIKPI
jgi:salicylate 5-hydroxylase small subunit